MYRYKSPLYSYDDMWIHEYRYVKNILYKNQILWDQSGIKIYYFLQSSLVSIFKFNSMKHVFHGIKSAVTSNFNWFLFNDEILKCLIVWCLYGYGFSNHRMLFTAIVLVILNTGWHLNANALNKSWNSIFHPLRSLFIDDLLIEDTSIASSSEMEERKNIVSM